MIENALAPFDAARKALAACVSIDVAKDIRDRSERLKVYARQVKDTGLMADATEIRLRSERRLGELLIAAKDAGQMGEGRPINGRGDRPFSRVTLQEAGVTKDLSSKAQKRAKMADDEFENFIGIERGKIIGGAAKPINGARSVMASRKEDADSLDYFPTPPWASRALLEIVLPHIGVDPCQLGTVWEPGCGEGHISGVLAEYGNRVIASDIASYDKGGRFPPGWEATSDFLENPPMRPNGAPQGLWADWIITNPPFDDKALAFALRALELARAGVALFVRQQWLEGVGRYEALFGDNPPTIYAQFSERVPLCKGRWDPDGSTATAYCWLVWRKGAPRLPTFWIPPGQREALTRLGDKGRFLAHPVREPMPGGTYGRILADAQPDEPASASDNWARLVAAYETPAEQDFVWSDAAVELLKAGFALESTGGAIAEVLGTTRGAVMAKASRLNLTDPARQGARTDLQQTKGAS